MIWIKQVHAYRVLHLNTLVAFDHTPWTDKSSAWAHAGLAHVRFDLDQLNGDEQRIAFTSHLMWPCGVPNRIGFLNPSPKDPSNDKSPALGNSRAGLFAGILYVGQLTPCLRLAFHTERSLLESTIAVIYIKGFPFGSGTVSS